MNAVELHRLARVLREMAVMATANPGEQPVAASTLAIVEDVAAHPGTSISQIVERTSLAQSLVSGTTARLTKRVRWSRNKTPTIGGAPWSA